MATTTSIPPVPTAASTRNDTATGILMILGAVTCFACLDTTAKWVNRSGDPLQTASFRYIGSFILVLVACHPWTGGPVVRSRHLGLQVARALGMVAATLLSFSALRRLPLTQATSITFAAPLIVALMAGPVLGETLGRHRIGAIAVGFIGVLVVTRPWSGAVQPAMLLAFGTALANASYALITRLLAGRDPPLTTLFYTGIIGGLLVLPVLPFVWAPPSNLPAWLALAALGVFGGLGQWLLIMAHQRAPASTLAPFFYAQLLGATLLGWLVFGELPDRWTLAGGAIVASSGLYLLRRERIRGAKPSADIAR